NGEKTPRGKREAATHPKKPKKSKQPPHKTPKNFANLSPGAPAENGARNALSRIVRMAPWGSPSYCFSAPTAKTTSNNPEATW
ncbi:MAG: hypothetical protein ACTSUQ_14650, partial [Candidatus Freyarchaeota archaeon]